MDVIKLYVDKFSEEIQSQPEENNERAACRDVYHKWLIDLDIHSALELGGGATPLLKLFPLMPLASISLGGEENAIKEDMNTPTAPDDSWDIVIARHALEHSLMPLIMLCEMARIATKYVLVIVPTCSEEMANYPNHYSVFTPVALRGLFKKAGLSLIKEELSVPLYDNICEDRFLLEVINA